MIKMASNTICKTAGTFKVNGEESEGDQESREGGWRNPRRSRGLFPILSLFLPCWLKNQVLVIGHIHILSNCEMLADNK
jgi:hypothetical protein